MRTKFKKKKKKQTCERILSTTKLNNMLATITVIASSYIPDLKDDSNPTFSVLSPCTPQSGVLLLSTHSHSIRRRTLFLTINGSLESPAATIFILFL